MMGELIRRGAASNPLPLSGEWLAIVKAEHARSSTWPGFSQRHFSAAAMLDLVLRVVDEAATSIQADHKADAGAWLSRADAAVS